MKGLSQMPDMCGICIDLSVNASVAQALAWMAQGQLAAES